MANETYETTCCVAGGGPAGMMLGYLLARAGVAVTVLEKHNDFFRDFRGDTVHPSTMELMYELGILEGFLKVPHQKLDTPKFHSMSPALLSTPAPIYWSVSQASISAVISVVYSRESLGITKIHACHCWLGRWFASSPTG